MTMQIESLMTSAHVDKGLEIHPKVAERMAERGELPGVNWQDIFDKFLVYLAALPARAAEMQGGAVKSEAPHVRKDFLTIPEIAERWRIARPTVYNRLKDAGVRVLDFAGKGARGRKIVPFGAVLEIERQQLRRL